MQIFYCLCVHSSFLIFCHVHTPACCHILSTASEICRRHLQCCYSLSMRRASHWFINETGNLMPRHITLFVSSATCNTGIFIGVLQSEMGLLTPSSFYLHAAQHLKWNICVEVCWHKVSVQYCRCVGTVQHTVRYQQFCRELYRTRLEHANFIHHLLTCLQNTVQVIIYRVSHTVNVVDLCDLTITDVFQSH